MKKRPTKVELRSEIDQQVADYLEQGGNVEHVDRGTSAIQYRDGPIKPTTVLFDQPRAERTLLPDVVAALESRRKPVKPATKRPRQQQAKKVPVYDDFGEVVRWVWRD